MNRSNSGRTGRRKHEAERKGLNEERDANLKDNYKMKRRTPDSDKESLEKEQDVETHHKRTRKNSYSSRRSLEEDFDVDRATITRDYEKEHGREARNSRKGNGDNRDQNYEAGSDGDSRDRKRHHSNIIKRKSSRHESKNNKVVIVEAESSDKDLFNRRDIETHDHSRKSMRKGRSGLWSDYNDYENEDEERLSRRKSDRRAHDHKK